MSLIFPDLGSPPLGWTVARHHTALRLIPPGAYADRCRASMSLSPLVAVSDAMPALDVLLQQSLDAECKATGVRVETMGAFIPIETLTGLTGTRLEISMRHREANVSQKRLYSMYRDDTWLYGMHYIADAATFPFLLSTYLETVQTLQPHP